MSCRHEWSPAYVCTLCGAVRHARVPYWAVIEPMASGPRGVWLALFTFADRQIPPSPIRPSNRAICERAGGITASTLGKHLDHLEANKWISRRGEGKRREILLAWGTPFGTNPRNIEDPRNIANPRNIAIQPPQYCDPTPAILRSNPRNIEDQILIDLIDDLRGVSPALASEVIREIVSVDRSWGDDLRDRPWADALTETIRVLGLEAREVGRVLAVWRDTDQSLSSAPARLRAQADGVYPPRREIWWVARHGAWLRRALEGSERRTAAPSGSWISDPCDDEPDRPWAAH